MNAGSQAGGALFVVDRKERRMLVLVSDGGQLLDVEAALLPKECRAEGAVLRVPLDANGKPDWNAAIRDRDEEKRRIADAAERLARLKRGDSGGDVRL